MALARTEHETTDIVVLLTPFLSQAGNDVGNVLNTLECFDQVSGTYLRIPLYECLATEVLYTYSKDNIVSAKSLFQQ